MIGLYPLNWGAVCMRRQIEPKEFLGVKRATHSDLWSYDVPQKEIDFIHKHVSMHQLADLRESGVS